MSADEIRSLARQAFADGIPSPSHRAGLLYIEDRCKQYATTLLAFAEVVERCEKIKSNYCLARNRIARTLSPHFDSKYAEINSIIAQLEYILRGDVGKEER